MRYQRLGRSPCLMRRIQPPLAQCFACQDKPACTLLVPLETFTLEKLAEQVLKKELNMANPELSLETGPWPVLGRLMFFFLILIFFL